MEAGRLKFLAMTLALALAALALPAAFAQAPAPAPQIAKEVVENPYGLQALWRQGDYVARGTLLVLLVMSIGTWYIAILKLLEQRRLLREAEEAEKKSVDALDRASAFRLVAETGRDAAERHADALHAQVDLNTWVGMALQRAIDRVANRLQGGLAFLATVGSTAPFVGLFGTVWGIYHALTAIGIAGQASIDKVAGPVGEALIMTAFGLAVAVPAVLAYNWLVRRNRIVLERLRDFAGGVHMTLLGSARGRPG